MSNNVLTISMAAYGEFDSLWATVRGLRHQHGYGFDLLVVDNAPRGCVRTRQVVTSAGGEYYHRPDLNGTSRPRAACFDLAKTPWVMVVDSHVTLANGAVDAAVRYADSHPQSKDLLSGPVVGDDDRWTSTHWSPPAGVPDALWGTWDCDAGYRARWGQGREAGEAAVAKMDPIEIPMMGLGLFMMRKAAWPGFNRLFRGFGGEEGYLHEKVRRLGGKCLCLPQLRWGHKFRDIVDWGQTPIPYPADSRDHVRNLLVGHRELGVPAYRELIKDHFGKKVDENSWRNLLAETEKSVPEGVLDLPPARQKILGVWYTNNKAPAKVLRASLDSIKAAADQSRHDVQIVTVPWESIPGNPFPQKVHKPAASGHAAIVEQILRASDDFYSTWGHGRPPSRRGMPPTDIISFLEHDVLYAPGYFDRVGDAFARNPDAPVVSHLDYIGLNGTGWLACKERHEPLHQLSVRREVATQNLFRAKTDCKKQGWAYLEPDHDGDRSKWVRIQPDGFAPSVHVNHPGRLTSHGEVCYEAVSAMDSGRPLADHPYWGSAARYWEGELTLGQAQQSQAGGGCGSCGKGGPPPPPEYTSLDEWAERGATGDFKGHMTTLRELASRVGRVTEVSSWLKSADLALAVGVSSRAEPGTFSSVCPSAKPQWAQLKRYMGDRFRSWTTRPEDPVDETDLLFLDTGHTADEVYGLLSLHHGKVTRYLVVHCTVTYGERGDHPNSPGVLPGLRRFLAEHREWTAVRHDTHDHGLMVLSRAAEDKATPPGLLTKALNFTKALAKHAADGQRVVADRVYELRMAECLTCEYRTLDTCGACGCPLDKKASWASEECGLVKLGRPPKWAAVTDPADLA